MMDFTLVFFFPRITEFEIIKYNILDIRVVCYLPVNFYLQVFNCITDKIPRTRVVLVLVTFPGIFK